MEYIRPKIKQCLDVNPDLMLIISTEITGGTIGDNQWY